MPSSLASGSTAVNALRIEGEDLAGVSNAVDYHRASFGRRRTNRVLPVGRKVVVIGGGNTAIDVAVQSKRLGAEDVTIVYRRGPESMRATGARAGMRADQRRQDQALGAAGARCSGEGVRCGRSSSNTRVLDAAGRLAGTGERFTLASRHGVQGDRPELRACRCR